MQTRKRKRTPHLFALDLLHVKCAKRRKKGLTYQRLNPFVYGRGEFSSTPAIQIPLYCLILCGTGADCVWEAVCDHGTLLEVLGWAFAEAHPTRMPVVMLTLIEDYVMEPQSDSDDDNHCETWNSDDETSSSEEDELDEEHSDENKAADSQGDMEVESAENKDKDGQGDKNDSEEDKEDKEDGEEDDSDDEKHPPLNSAERRIEAIRREQRRTNLIISSDMFRDYCLDILDSCSHGHSVLDMSLEATCALQHASEDYLVRLFQQGMARALKAKRITVYPEDFYDDSELTYLSHDRILLVLRSRDQIILLFIVILKLISGLSVGFS